MRQLLIVCLISGSAWAAEAPGQQVALSQKEIDKAVARGLDYLKARPRPHGHRGFKDSDELIMLACVHGGMSEKNEFFTEMLERKLVSRLEKTYKVALLAMTLEELNRVKYQLRIAQCGQFLADNQAANGQWSYGRPTDINVNIKDIPSVASGGAKKKRKPFALRRFGALREKPKVVRKIRITQNKTTGTQGDNSNTQYASLGLRACFDAGILFDEQVVYKARQWWVESQHPPEDGAGKDAVASGSARPRGWSYTNLERTPERKAYHAMTAGAIGAVCIYDYMLGKNFKTDPLAKDGVAWMAKHFAVNGNYYYMYGLERAGMLYGTDKFGDHDWYIEGAKYILSKQNANGSWTRKGDDGRPSDVWNTCFAILFLKKATRMIATGGGN